ncbi:MAG: cyclase [Nitrosopumilales archaeon CG11_big_fil_rev_8_21_14_0_20_33_24]|nr:MAG: cyclase [Nitrosopumilales archaeon CG11_big_fil_rev_8_21_14_0_20_33_24]PIY90444.1 MAG: cyclase [Nitrosopumilales archaeon CG_4_10_14_0_8_um_filter_34_8]PJB98409.1 MAG: cyclase [Nitrosopumilales archaeon CG_4_9_14_0_8_um_filter_34_10]
MKPLDLTLTISTSIPTFPDSPKPQFILWSTLKEDKYNLELLFLSSHTGTHLDAPYHFVKNGIKIHQIPLDRLLGNGILIKIKKEKNQSITKNDLISFERKNGNIPKHSSIFFYTEWQKHLNSDYYFINNPGLSESAATYLVSKRINLVGIDSPSIDLGQAKNFRVHKILAKNNILIVENLSNLNKISSKQFDFVILPLKLKDATGSPVRAIAIQ